jgi:hypothetical protein
LRYSFTTNPPDGQGRFVINEKDGRLYSVNPIGFDFETVPQYTLTVAACAFSNCTLKDVTINIGNVDEPPLCEPTLLEVTVDETQTWVSFTCSAEFTTSAVYCGTMQLEIDP